MTERSAMDWGSTPDDAARAYQAYMVPGMFLDLADRVVDKATPLDGARVLDIACGTGSLSRKLAEAGASVTGVDLAPPMLEVARELSSGIAFMEAGADALPFPDDSFDVVTCQQGLQFFPDRPAALAEMRRVMRDGGRVIVACWCDHTQGGFLLIDQALHRHMGEKVAAMIRAPYVLNTEPMLEELLIGAGFSEVEVGTETVAARFVPGIGFASRVIAGGPVAGVFSAAAPEVRSAVDGDVDTAIQPMLDGDAAVFPMPSLLGSATA